MPVTKTATRALRSSKRKEDMNRVTKSNLEIAVRLAKKTKKATAVSKAVSLVDRAAKKNLFHKNKAARLKAQLSKFAKPASKKSASAKKSPLKK